MKLCIAEKPSVAGDIASVLGAKNRNSGFYEGNGYCVTWVFGHLCELKEPHDYKAYWRSWSLYDLPIIPESFGIKLKDDDGVRRQFDIIKALVARAEEVINCGDAGQEGELIQRWVLQLAGVKCPIKRLWISSLTEESIREGFANLKDSAEFDKLYAAGSARAIGDWLLGMNATRAFTLKYGRDRQVLSIGRVQTPTLSLIVQRFNEIKYFVPEPYWELKTLYRGVTFSVTKGRYSKREEAEAALSKIVGSDFEVTDVQIKEGSEAPPRLFDLTALQVECNKKYAFSADETLKIIQLLYEKKLTTYPRVDTTYLSDDIYPKVPDILRGMQPYAALIAPLLQGKLKKSKKVFDNSKVTDHHAIIPTGVTPTSSLSRNEKLVYNLVALRFIANFYPDAKISTTTVMGVANEVEFKCSGKQILSPGWRSVYGQKKQNEEESNDSDEEQVMPSFVKGERGAHEPSLQEKQTQPPKPYTEATLLRAMETAGKQVEDEELRDLMKDNGIGRPSTRAAIIETLFKRHYIVKNRKNLEPTIVGIQLIGLIRQELLKSVELTGLWERNLRMIEKGSFSTTQFMDDMRHMVSETIAMVNADNSGVRIDTVDIEDVASKESKKANKQTVKTKDKETDDDLFVCPRCQRPVLKGKSAWGCSGFREGCTVVVPFEVMGKKLTAAQAKALFAKGETGVIKGLVQNGETVSGKLAFDSGFSIILKPAEGKSGVDVSTLACPLCGGKMLEGKNAWGCCNYTKGCRFVVPYEYMGKRLTSTQLSVLCKKRRTGVINGFVDAAGAKVSGRLVVGDDGMLTLER
jgi:DNA topoisomerase-3